MLLQPTPLRELRILLVFLLVAGETAVDPLPQATGKHSPQSNAVRNEIEAYTRAAPFLERTLLGANLANFRDRDGTGPLETWSLTKTGVKEASHQPHATFRSSTSFR